MKLTVERFEGDIAVCETDSGFIDIPRDKLPSDCREGDIVEKTDEGFKILRDETKSRRDKMRELLKRLMGE